MRAARAEDDGEVDPLAVHRLSIACGIVTRQVFGRVLVAILSPGDGRSAFSRRMRSSSRRSGRSKKAGKHLALELPAVGVRAVDRREARRASLNRGSRYSIPEVVRLVDVDVAVHHLEAALGHEDLLSRDADVRAR